MRDSMISVLAKTSSAVTEMPGEITFISNLFFLLLLAIPAIAIILSIFILKRSTMARILTTLFVVTMWLLTLIFMFLLGAPSFPILLPTLLGAVVLYYLWFDKKTALLFGSSADMKVNLSLIGSDFSKMPGKVKLLILLNLIPAILLALLLVVALVFLSIGGRIGSNIRLFAVLLLLIGLWLVVPYLIWKRNKIGRYLGIVGAFLDLFAFPIGTVLGIVLLYLFFHPEVKAYFEKEAGK